MNERVSFARCEGFFLSIFDIGILREVFEYLRISVRGKGCA